MILTPLQALGMVAFTVLLCAIAMYLIHRYAPTGLHKRVTELEWAYPALRNGDIELEKRLHRLEKDFTEQRVYGRPVVDLDSADDVLDLWNAIVETEKHQDKRS